MPIIGIDLGTSNSAAAVLRGGRPVIIPSAEGVSLGGKAFPSYVAVAPDGQIIVGEPARRQAVSNPEGTATGFKRRMGHREKIRLRDREFTPEQLSAFLLQKIKRDAEVFLGEPVTKAVVTVPAYFDDNQRNATKDACQIAGLEPVRLVNEPTAASLAYGLDRLGSEFRIAVIDLGGGTLDVTIMEFGGGVFEVVATSGDTMLGGTDMNYRIYDELVDRFCKETGFNIKMDKKAPARLLEAAEVAKVDLTTSMLSHISLPYIGARDGQPLHLETDLTRAQLESLIMPVIERCRRPVEQALHDVHKTAKDIERIVFVGGPTRMPIVRCYFEKLFGKSAESGVDPMECVASGAAIQAGVLAGEVHNIILVDVTPLTLGVETLGGIATPLIARNSPIPCKRTETFTTAADMQTAVTIHVFQGERAMSADNTSLGEFNLEGLPPAPRGVPKIEVTFDIDASGILSVTASDLATLKSRSITITGSTRLPQHEKQRMIDEAERYQEQDQKRREEIEKLNTAESVYYQGEKLIADFGDTIGSDLRNQVEAAMKDLRDSVTHRDANVATERSERLKKILQQVGASIYSQAASNQPEPHPQPDVPPSGDGPIPSGAGPRGSVVDAEYVKSVD